MVVYLKELINAELIIADEGSKKACFAESMSWGDFAEFIFAGTK